MKNAPSVKEFRVGMRVKLPEFLRHGGEWATVRWVEVTGMAHCETDDHDAVFPQAKHTSECFLDLDSIWEGREYENARGEQCCVLFVSDYHVVLRVVLRFDDTINRLWTRPEFLAEWTPIPLSPEKPPETHRPLSQVVAELKVNQHNPWFEPGVKAILPLVVEALERLAEGGK